MTFILDKTLEQNSYYLTNFDLCQVRLINNSNYPWFLLIPMKNNLIEITDLDLEDFDLFNHEIRKIAQFLNNEFKPDKLNIATIGNIVPQLHAHVIARFKNDALFPKTVWGHEFVPYDNDNLHVKIKTYKKILEA